MGQVGASLQRLSVSLPDRHRLKPQLVSQRAKNNWPFSILTGSSPIKTVGDGVEVGDGVAFSILTGSSPIKTYNAGNRLCYPASLSVSLPDRHRLKRWEGQKQLDERIPFQYPYRIVTD